MTVALCSIVDIFFNIQYRFSWKDQLPCCKGKVWTWNSQRWILSKASPLLVEQVGIPAASTAPSSQVCFYLLLNSALDKIWNRLKYPHSICVVSEYSKFMSSFFLSVKNNARSKGGKRENWKFNKLKKLKTKKRESTDLFVTEIEASQSAKAATVLRSTCCSYVLLWLPFPRPCLDREKTIKSKENIL